jgi:endoglucanase
MHQHFSLAPLGAITAALLAASCVPQKGGGNEPGAPVSLPSKGGNLIKNADFEDGTSLPWTLSFTPPADGNAEVKGGWLCLNVKNKGKSPWDAQLRHREMVIQRGHTYYLSFRAKASVKTRIRSKVGQAGPPYREYWVQTMELGPEPKQVTDKFTMSAEDDPTAEWAFHGGGTMALPEGNFTFCIDDVKLIDPEFTPSPKETRAPIPNIRVNQVGYLPQYSKHAVLVTQATTPVKWELVDGAGSVVASGDTLPFGEDLDSGDRVHTIDFSAFQQRGKGFKLRAGTDESPPFDISTGIYGQMKYDALWYFYHNRSGIELALPYAGQPAWTRPAGHLSDKSVPCAPNVDAKFKCGYSLDVTGGWYDAGDHGKYVVNGGIALFTMQNQYERMKHLAPKSLADFGDGKLRIPENHNQRPDILDEARWELQWMLKMQVPEGQPHAGMAHHKIHDENWTALGLRPPTDTAEIKMNRFLRPVSTAATLNLAAVAAQGARIWDKLDPEFSRKCLEAAKRAWKAARAEPGIFAPKSDGMGGGAYDDVEVSDEFYWAAVELYLTTGESEYQDFLTKSPFYLRIPRESGAEGGGVPSAMTWQNVTALGTISLAVVPSLLGHAAIEQARKEIINTADEYLKLILAQGYRLPFKPGKEGKYPWGSNSFVLNNLVVLGLAHDFSKQPKYVDGALDGIDYLLGENAMGQSYVTSYGTKYLEYPHHRFWSWLVDKRLPKAPPGCVSGGPNSGLEDPYVQAAGLKGCRPQKCFVDHIEAWSVNEITINWNAPFAWVTAFLDEKSKEPAVPGKAPAAKGPAAKGAGAKSGAPKPAKGTAKGAPGKQPGR